MCRRYKMAKVCPSPASHQIHTAPDIPQSSNFQTPVTRRTRSRSKSESIDDLPMSSSPVKAKRFSSSRGAKRKSDTETKQHPFKRSGPKNFLLGGNIWDPLNLNSLKERDSQNPTPEQSPRSETPLNDPIEVVIPRSSKDPLNLEKPEQSHHQGGRRKRKQRRESLKPEDQDTISFSDSEIHTSRGSSKKTDLLSPEASPIKRPRLFSGDSKTLPKRIYDPIVSPIAPSKPPPSQPVSVSPEMKKKSSKEKDPKRFRYGNYNRYYGKRLPDKKEEDPRLALLKPNWIQDQDVLDIGCNVGHVTSILAREFKPRKILGLDIDGGLIGVARKNVRHYCDKIVDKDIFPQNLVFRQGNYVLASDDLLEAVQPEYDTILAMSVTKWIHLNWGDSGLKRFFRRAYRHLRDGGRFVLEPQPFASYKRRKKITPEMTDNFKNIQLKPDQFSAYLLSPEVGFDNFELLRASKPNAKGFERPILVFFKANKGEDSTTS